MIVLKYVLILVTVFAVVDMVIATVKLLKNIKKNRDDSVESIKGSIRDFIISIAILIGAGVIVSIIKLFID